MVSKNKYDIRGALDELSSVTKMIRETHLKKLTEHQKSAFLEIDKINESLRQETERGCVVIAAAFLDEKLTELLNKITTGNSTIKKELFDATGPLGSFSGKIKIAYCFGLISDEAYHDLNVVRFIRNKFAHLSVSLTLRDEKLAAKCSSLRLPGIMDFSPIPRLAFTNSVAAIVSEINEAIERKEPFVPHTSLFIEIKREIETEKKNSRKTKL